MINDIKEKDLSKQVKRKLDSLEQHGFLKTSNVTDEAMTIEFLLPELDFMLQVVEGWPTEKQGMMLLDRAQNELSREGSPDQDIDRANLYIKKAFELNPMLDMSKNYYKEIKEFIGEEGIDKTLTEEEFEEELEDYDIAPLDVGHILELIGSWPKEAKARYLIEISKIISKTEEMNGAMFQVAAAALDNTVVLDKDYEEEIIMLCEKELIQESCYAMIEFLNILEIKKGKK
jgi:hypothetical protein